MIEKMSDDLKLQDSVRKTQELLSKYIKKPPLTDKLLKKPPFRFLHDIINAINKETGFLQNLFTDDESDSSCIKDKEAKLMYLNKLIDAVKLITGNELSVRASKIISGLEPIKTNELLQVIGRALDKQVSSIEAIEYYKKNLEKKDNLKSKLTKANASREEKLKKSVKKSSPSETKLSSKEKTKQKNDEPKSNARTSSRETKIHESSNERRDSRTTTRDNKKREMVIDASKKRQNQVLIKKRVKGNDKVDVLNLPSTEKKKIEIIEPAVVLKIVNMRKEEHQISENYSIPTTQENKKKIMNEKSNNESKDVASSKKQLENREEKIEENLVNNVTTKLTDELLKLPSARPSSARPAAPRTRGKADFMMNNDRINQLGDMNSIEENSGTRDDDDDMVVMETVPHDDPLFDGGSAHLLNTQLTQEHGYLVAQILETQKELINGGDVELIPNKVKIEWESGLKKDRYVIVEEIDKLRGTIQTLTKTTNPLRKLLDFLQEDIEIMEKELHDWQKQFEEVRAQLIMERYVTTDSLKPLEGSLKEVEITIISQIEKIFQTKANIVKNNQKIQKLLNSK